MKKIILSAAFIAFAGVLTVNANGSAGRDTASFSRDTASFNLDTAQFRDTAAFKRDTALFTADTASFNRDTALFAADTAQFRDTAAFQHDTALLGADTAAFKHDTSSATIHNDTAAVFYGAMYAQEDTAQKTPVRLETLPEPVKSTLQSGELKQWSPSAAFMVKTDTSAYYQVFVQKGSEGKNVNIDERGAVIR